MDIQHLKAELSHHKMAWNQLVSHFDKTEQRILDCIRNGETDTTIRHYETLKDLESQMRPLRNNLIFVCENLAQFYRIQGNLSEENGFMQKAEKFQKSRYKRNNRRLRLSSILNRNGILV